MNALSPAPQRARSASPDRRIHRAQGDRVPPRRAGIGRRDARADRAARCCATCPAAWLISRPGTRNGLTDSVLRFARPGLLGFEKVHPSECRPDHDGNPVGVGLGPPRRSIPASAQASRAAFMESRRNRDESLWRVRSPVPASGSRCLDDPGYVLKKRLGPKLGVAANPRPAREQPLPGRVHVRTQTGHCAVPDDEDPLWHDHLLDNSIKPAKLPTDLCRAGGSGEMTRPNHSRYLATGAVRLFNLSPAPTLAGRLARFELTGKVQACA